MKPNPRVLVLVFALLATLAAGVSLLRPRSASYVEYVGPRGQASSTRQEGGLQLRLNKDEVSFSIAGCNSKPFADKFFLHVYTEGLLKRGSGEFLNRDFDLASLPMKKLNTAGEDRCLATRAFESNGVKEIVL